MNTLPELLHNTVVRFGKQTAIIEPSEDAAISTLSYEELQQRVHSFAGHLQKLQVKKGDKLMIWSASRANWLIAYLGALLTGMSVVPLDVNSREDFLQRIAVTTEVKFLVTTQKQYNSLQEKSIPLIDIDSLPVGTLNIVELPPISADELAQIVFTSGTTGQPKGVMLSHKNIVSNAIAAVEVVTIRSNDRALSTCVVLVPQALQLMLSGIQREVRRTHREKQWQFLHRLAIYLPFGARRLLFRAVQQRFGSHFRFFVSGGAYLSPELAQQWEEMGFRVLQGYGATECAPIVSATPYHDHHLASIGKPLPGIEVKIAEDKEILVHGPNVSTGYWKNPEATNAVFHDGWYYTGDLGYFDDRGNLYLKGRKKNLIVLANGMNVYPEDVENVLHSSGAPTDQRFQRLARERFSTHPYAEGETSRSDRYLANNT